MWRGPAFGAGVMIPVEALPDVIDALALATEAEAASR